MMVIHIYNVTGYSIIILREGGGWCVWCDVCGVCVMCVELVR